MTDITDPSSVFASLRGGSSAIRGGDRFIMQNADMGTAIGKWEFNLVNRDDIPTTIATMELQGRKLVFQWRPEAQDLKMAGQLHNCAISFTSGKFSHILALREVIEVPAPQVNLDRGIVSVTWDLPLPPDPDAIYVELAGVTGPLPNQKTVPQQPLNVTGDGQWILVGTPKNPVMSFLANWTVKRGIEVDFSTHLFPANGVPRKSNASKSRLNKKVLTQERIRWTQEYAGLKRALDTKYSGAARNQVPKPLQANFDAEKAVVQRRYEQAQTTAVAVQKLVDLYPQIHEKSGLEFRVYHDADQTQVDLLRTSGYAAAKKSIKPGK
ncbi:MAG TPA: hypothetical protein EYG57_09770 [Planctomycetes bacterium]|nr:hypothetical protein [Planctomycetota bacterium]